MAKSKSQVVRVPRGAVNKPSKWTISDMVRKAAEKAALNVNFDLKKRTGSFSAPFQSPTNLLSTPAGRKSRMTPESSIRKIGSRFGGVSTGYYKGRFKKATRKGVKTGTDIYAKTGVVQRVEIHGKIDDVDVVYLGHNTFQVSLISEVIAKAILRKLFTKHGFTFNDDQEIINGSQTGFTIRWSRRRTSDGAMCYSSISTFTGMTLNLLIGNTSTPSGASDWLSTASLKDQIAQSMYVMNEGYGNNMTGNFECIEFYSSGSAMPTGQLKFEEEVLDLQFNSKMIIQNRTKSDSGSTEIETVDNQPLKGFQYLFAGGVAHVKNDGKLIGTAPVTGTPAGNVINQNRSEGILLVRGGEFPASQQNWKEPPAPRVFANCYKASKVLLQPGSIKGGYIVSRWRGYFNNLLNGKLIVKANVGTVSAAPGKLQMFALEERLNSGSLNKITVNYECEKTCGARFISVKKPNYMTGFIQQEISNISPS